MEAWIHICLHSQELRDFRHHPYGLCHHGSGGFADFLYAERWGKHYLISPPNKPGAGGAHVSPWCG